MTHTETSVGPTPPRTSPSPSLPSTFHQTYSIDAGRFTFQKCPVHRLVPGHGNPRPYEIAVLTPDGEWVTGDQLLLVSPSQLTTEDRCQRKWGLYAIDKITKEQTKAQELGTALHAQLEAWLGQGVPPSSDRLTDSGALSHFPAPFTPGLRIEQCFAICITDNEATDQALSEVYFWGFKDVELIGTVALVQDLKTTKSFDWQKTEDELAKDVQGNVYALDAALSGDFSTVTLKWVYARTQGAPASDCTEVELSVESVVKKSVDLAERAFRMAFLKRQSTLEIRTGTREQVPILGADGKQEIGKDGKPRFKNALFSLRLNPNASACGDFGGCEYRAICGDLKKGSTLAARRAQEKLEKERHVARVSGQTVYTRALVPEADGIAFFKTTKTTSATAQDNNMGLMDKVRAGKVPSGGTTSVATGDTVEAPPPAQPAASAPTASAATTTGAASGAVPAEPKRGLKALLGAKAAAASATGVVSSDAKPPPPKPSEVAVATPALEPDEVEMAGEASETAQVAPGTAIETEPDPAPAAETAAPQGPQDAPPAKGKPGRKPGTPNKPKAPAAAMGFVLLIGVKPQRGNVSEDIETVLAPLRLHAETSRSTFGTAGLFLELVSDVELPAGIYHADTRFVEPEVLAILARRADALLA